MTSHRSRPQAGFTFAELAFAVLILVISAVVLLNHLSVNYQTTMSERDRVFAFSKAQAILSEIQAYVNSGSIEAVELDTLDDGTTNKFPLSIQTDSYGALVPADHIVSGNFQRNGQWLWSRRITVQPFAGVDNRNVRYVTVRVYRRDAHGVERSLADLSAVINSSSQSWPSTQVYDLYLFAVENIPGWWVFMDSIRPFMESMITDLETRNPGLELRTHWITKASFGRNQTYRPYTNSVLDTTAAAVPDVYYYPGRMPTGSASAFYYVPENIKARLNIEGLEANGYSPTNPHPYALADFFNHGMRYPDELALWQRRVQAVTDREADIAAAVAGGTTPPDELDDMSKEPTLRLFLEDLNTNPNKYKNAIVMNLHGELLPMPALRNFSDPAKSQQLHENLRVVTHPEELRTRNNDAGVTSPLNFRIYAYGHQTSLTPYTTPRMTDPIVVEFVGVDLTDAVDPTRLAPWVSLTNVRGGAPVAGNSDYSTAWLTAKHASDGSLVANEMYYRAEFVPPDTVNAIDGCTRVYLFHTPIGAKPVTQGGLQYGLAATERARLYQMEYVPCPVGTVVGTPSFLPDLTSPGFGPKNTARWRLSIGTAVLSASPSRFVTSAGIWGNPTGDVVMQVRTRIGAGSWQTSGTTFPTVNDPDNLSTTYAWWTDSAQDVPITERAQFNGDPRHMPYLDCVNGGNDFPNSYNWYHDNLNNSAEAAINDFPCFQTAVGPVTPLRNHWAGLSLATQSPMACDVPRYMQLLREGLVKSRCVYSSLTGWSYYYLGIGADIGYDAANGYPNSIPTNLDPFGSPGSSGYVDNILNNRRVVCSVGTEVWWGMPWLGELAPDNVVASSWLTTSAGGVRGNLPTGLAPTQFFQYPQQTVYSASNRQAYGTAMHNHGQRLSTYGCTTLFNIGTSASTFQHSSSTANGTLSATGAELAANYNLDVPASVPVTRPFRINVATTVPEHWNFAPYTTRYSASLYQTYYTHASGSGSAVVKLVDPTNTNAAYVVVNGIANTVTNGTPFIAQWNLLALVHTLLEAGSTANTLRIKEQPRVEIESPTDITELIDPATIPVQYSIEWARWDGLPYTATGTFGESETELEYSILYSRDGGTTWAHIQDDTPALAGVRPAAGYLLPDGGAGNETYVWNVASGFPEGTYVLRVDCYRVGASVHYAYHQTRLFIQR